MQALFLEKQFFFHGLSRARFKQKYALRSPSSDINFIVAGSCPDLESTLTSLVTVSTDAAQVLMACDVPSITLAEVFFHYSEDHTYDNLLAVWLEGRKVNRKRAQRGRSSTAPNGKDKGKGENERKRQLVLQKGETNAKRQRKSL